MTLIISPLLCQIPTVRAAGGADGALIDVFTQKTPYNGIGLNASSDAFGPDELVILFANVTYNAFPVQERTVTFIISGPPDPTYNFTVSQTTLTNVSGIATTNFRFPWSAQSPETAEFGTWSARANADVAGETISDEVDFQVGWLIQITALSIKNQFPQLQNTVMKGTNLTAQLELTNICMTSKNVTLSLSAKDSLEQPVGAVIIEGFIAEPGQNYANVSLQIKGWARIGNASLTASVAPYESSISITFKIAILGDLDGDDKVDIRDLAIAAQAFGSHVGSPDWNSVADINQDGVVDIRDLVLIAKNFGNADP